MSNNISLNCAILGPDLKRITDFSISINAFVKDLKWEIKKERQQGLRHVDADRIDLWMLYVPLSQKDAIKRFGSKVTLREEKEIDKLVEELDDLEPLSKYFDNSLERTKIHILVEVPSIAAYQPLADLEGGILPTNKTGTAELRDARSFWERWWGCSEPVFVTKQTERGENPIKLTMDNKCFVIEGHRFMPLRLQNGMLVRIEYRRLTEYLENVHKVKIYGTIIVCGHPGIGKSSYLYVLLAIRLKAGETVVFQTETGSVFLFTRNGVQLMSSTIDYRDVEQYVPRGTWGLIDAGAAFTTPAKLFTLQRHLFVVLASSPRKEHWDSWVKTTRPLGKWFMNPWTLEELIHARSLQDSPPTEKSLETLFTYYSPSARTVYEVGDQMPSYAHDIRTEVMKLKSGDLISVFRDTDGLQMDRTSHEIFVVYPESDSNRGAHITKPASEKIMRMIFQQDIRNEVFESIQLYRHYLSRPETRAMAGLILELRIDAILSHSGQEFDIQRLERSPKESFDYFVGTRPPSRSKRRFFRPEIKEFGKASTLIETEGLRGDLFYIPTHRKYPLLDYFIYEPDTHTITFFQVTVAVEEHTMKHTELEDIVRALTERDPTATFKYEYIAIVPQGERPKLKISQAWKGNIDVFVLEVYHDMLRFSKKELREGWALPDREEWKGEDVMISTSSSPNITSTRDQNVEDVRLGSDDMDTS